MIAQYAVPLLDIHATFINRNYTVKFLLRKMSFKYITLRSRHVSGNDIKLLSQMPPSISMKMSRPINFICGQNDTKNTASAKELFNSVRWVACGSLEYFVEIVKVEAVHFRFQYQYTFPISVTNFENEPQSI